MTARVVDLDHPSARDPAIAGAKAAGLARARVAGFPVLDGFVVPAAASAGVLDAARDLMATGGSGAARMAILRSPLNPALLDDIARAGAALAPPLIARSSSVLEDDGRWSGAFTSVPEVASHELPKAIRSVWATCFALDVIERCGEAGIEPGTAPMAVLVQPEIGPDFGGTATVDTLGAVSVIAVKGGPRDLLAGWVPGARAVFEQGDLVGGEAVDLMGESQLQAVVDLALRVRAELGHDLLEWAVLDGRPVLLQVRSAAAGRPPEPAPIPAALGHPFARALAVLAHRYPGSLGEELVLGWLPGMVRSEAGLDGLGRPGTECAGDPGADLEEARRLAVALTATAWGEPPDRAVAHARLVLRRLRSDRPNESIEALRDLRPVDPAPARRLLAIHAQLASRAGSQRRGRDRWEPLLAGVAALQGRIHVGRPSVAGTGAGRLVWVDSPTRTDHVRPRDIVVAQYPLPNFSPLLWDAAGVVTVGGAASAHLFEVARSLTVPAVVDCPAAAAVRNGPVLGMVDGDTGRIALLD